MKLFQILLMLPGTIRLLLFPLTAGFVLSLALTSCNSKGDDSQVSEPEIVELKEPAYLYGICIDSLEVIRDTVERNQFLADILSPYQVEYQLIDRIARNRDVFDVRRIRAGNPFTILAQPVDSTLKARHFIYEIDKVNYLVYDFAADSIHAYKGNKPIRKVERQVAGVIESSLYQSLMDAGASPVLANSLADIYAWSVDFYRIQPGDRYKAVYTENWVEDERIGVDSIFAAVFNYRDVDFYAFQYDQDSLGSYYDEEGNSLQKAFLQAPLKFSRISSRYSKKRFHPVLKRYKSHLGTDYAAATGTPIRATGDGVVVAASYTKGNGRYVKIRHNSTYTTQYLHMSRYGKGIKSGVAVRQGQVIGYVGSTGLATGPHLCYRFWKNGVQVDPFHEKLPPAFPIKESHKDRYSAVVNQWTAKLGEIEYPASGVTDTEIPVSGAAFIEASAVPVPRQ